MHEDPIVIRLDGVVSWLVGKRVGGVNAVTYADLGDELGVNPHVGPLPIVLAELVRLCARTPCPALPEWGRYPCLPAMVTRRDTGEPGTGFFKAFHGYVEPWAEESAEWRGRSLANERGGLAQLTSYADWEALADAAAKASPILGNHAARAQAIMRYLSAHGKSSVGDITSGVPLNDGQVRRALKQMVDDGEVTRTGHGAGTRYSC